jgi:hypothetical protein
MSDAGWGANVFSAWDKRHVSDCDGGLWPRWGKHCAVFPFSSVLSSSGTPPESALNAYADIWLQLRLAGIFALLAAFVRAWLVASERLSAVYVGPALTLVLLAATRATKSYLFYEGELFLFATSAFAAARNHSRRGGLTDTKKTPKNSSVQGVAKRRKQLFDVASDAECRRFDNRPVTPHKSFSKPDAVDNAEKTF